MARKTLIMTAAFAAILAATPALACKGSKVLFEDKFSFADAAWDLDDVSRIDPGALTITADANAGDPVLYMGDTFLQADVCVDVVTPQVKNIKDDYLSAGIVFLAVDYDAYHYLWLSPAGYVGVSRLADNKWTSPVPSRQVAINSKVGGTNTLRVTYGGGKGTLYVNDKKIADFRAQDSNGAQYVGLRGNSEKTAATPWKFTNVKITDVPK